MASHPVEHFLSQVRATLARYALFQPGERVLVAVSGGPDSLALLYALHALTPELRLTLSVAHLNHRLRPEADADARFVTEVAGQLGVSTIVETADVRAAKESSGLSLEHAARRERYRFFRRAAQAVGARKVATAHTADDNVETLLINLLRGAGSEGLAGIPPLRPLAADTPLAVVRPLLDLWRADVLAYCRALALQPREDASNRSREFLRNRVRLDLLPHLQENFGPQVKPHLHQITRLLRPEAEFIAQAAEEALQSLARPIPGGLSLPVDALNALHLALRRRVVRSALQQAGAPIPELGLREVERVLQAAGSAGDTAFDLPGPVRVAKSRGEITLAAPVPLPFPTLAPRPLRVPGSVPLPDGGAVEARALPRPEAFALPRIPRAREVFLDADAVRLPLIARARRPGDRLAPLGMAGHKTLHRLFIDARVPAAERARVPIVADAEGILWVAGLVIADRARVTPQTRCLLRLVWLAPEEAGVEALPGE